MIHETAALAARATADPAAFTALFDQFYPRLYNYFFYRCSDPAAAEDLAAQVFERLLGALDRYQPERGPFEAWLFAIARNLAADYGRAQRLRSFLPWERALRHPAGDPAPEEMIERRELQARLRAVLPRLNDRERDLLGLRFSTALSHHEIAALTGLSEDNVAVTLHRTLRRLRQWIDISETLPSLTTEAPHV